LQSKKKTELDVTGVCHSGYLSDFILKVVSVVQSHSCESHSLSSFKFKFFLHIKMTSSSYMFAITVK